MKKVIIILNLISMLALAPQRVSATTSTHSTPVGTYEINNLVPLYSPTETPHLTIQGRSNFGQLILKFITSFFRDTPNLLEVKDPRGQVIHSQKLQNEPVDLVLDQVLTPGTYSIYLNNQLLDQFSWGVLALNSDKDVYQLGETAQLAIGILDSSGQVVCNSDVSLEIIDPTHDTTTLSTANSTIVFNSAICTSTDYTLLPDYSTSLPLTKEGIYHLKLKAQGSFGQWEDEYQIKVDNLSPFTVTRTSPTRLYPLNHYPMIVQLHSQTNLKGYKIVENYPAQYQITHDTLSSYAPTFDTLAHPQLNRSFTIDQDTNDYSFYYVFDPPNPSPDLFVHQPLQIYDPNNVLVYSENRSFITLNDSTAVASYYLNTSGNWTAPSGVTSVSVEAWGGGGGGAGNTTTTVYAEAGGGGGGYSKLNTYAVTPSSSYAYSAGAGGTRSAGAGGDGGDSNFINSSTLLAKGGTQGSGDTAGSGGASGSGVGDTKYTGGAGAAGTASATAGGAGGGAAGTNGNGSAGSGATGGAAGTDGGAGAPSPATTEQNGRGGQSPGGGGSGGYLPDATDHSGGVGGSGMVKISYTTAYNAPTLVGVGAQTTTTTTTRTPVLPGGVTTGDLILIYVVHRADVDPTYTITGYTQRASQYYDVGTGDLDIEVWYKIAGSSEGNPSITASTGTNGWSAQTVVYRGVDTTNPFDITNAVTGTNAAAETFTPTGVTTTSSYALAISAVATYDDNNLTLNTSTGFGGRMEYTSYTTVTGSDHSFALSDSIVPSNSAVTFPTWRQTLDTGTGTSLTYDQWVYISDALNPINNTPVLPTLDSPSDTATNQSLTPTLLTTATDYDSDYLRYKIELCENVGMSTNCQTFDQTSSQTGWSGQNTQTSTAYTSGTQASYTLQTPLATNTTYYWKSQAIDPGGINTWSATQTTPYSFSTTSAPSAPTTPYAEGTSNPTGIIDLTPEFSAAHSDPDSDAAVYYEIEVNTASNFGGTVMWDSGAVSMSSLSSGVRSTDVSYAGSSLSYNGTFYYWRIRFTDNKGATGAWSATQNFSTNHSPLTPTLDSPSDTATNQSLTPTLLTTATDSNTASWYNTSWLYRIKVTIDADFVDADLTDFPVYLDLNDMPASFHTNVNQTDARDIRVTKADGTTELPREVVFYTAASDTGELHFKYSGTLSGTTDTDIYVYYGNSGASDYAVTDTYGRNNVWDDIYNGVWHLQETSGSRIDSSGNNNTLSDNNTVLSGTGVMGNAADFESTNNEYLSITDASQNGLEPTTNFTVSAWHDPENNGGTNIVGKGRYQDDSDTYNLGFDIGAGYSGIYYRIDYDWGLYYDLYVYPNNVNDMTHSVVVHNGTSNTEYLYIDGAEADTVTNTTNDPGDNTAPFVICNNQDSRCDGLTDEVRFSATALPATWISTEYNNQSNGNFYVVGNEQSPSYDYLRYKIELCENVGMSTNCQTFDQTSSQTGWSGQNTQTSTAYTSGTQASYTLQTPLSELTTYYWRSYAIDPAGSNTWGNTQGTPYSFTTLSSAGTDTLYLNGINFSGVTIQ